MPLKVTVVDESVKSAVSPLSESVTGMTFPCALTHEPGPPIIVFPSTSLAVTITVQAFVLPNTSTQLPFCAPFIAATETVATIPPSATVIGVVLPAGMVVIRLYVESAFPEPSNAVNTIVCWPLGNPT